MPILQQSLSQPAAGLCAHQCWIGLDATPGKFKSVGIPARPNGGVRAGFAVRMSSQGALQQRKPSVIQIEALTTQLRSVQRGLLSVAHVMNVTRTTRIMEQGKELHDLNVGSARGSNL